MIRIATLTSAIALALALPRPAHVQGIAGPPAPTGATCLTECTTPDTAAGVGMYMTPYR